jgi:hypothetical protein
MIGLPSGMAWAVFVAFDHEWKTSIIIGAIFGLFVGVVIAFINAREFSKNTYPINLNPLPNAQVEQNEFQPQGFSLSREVIGIGLIILLFIFSLFDSPQSSSLASTLYLSALLFIASLGWLISFLFTRMSVSIDGIELRSLLYKITVDWKEVERIERRGKKWFLICRTSKISSLPFFSDWLKFIEADKMILLDTFTSNFPESELARAILHYENQVSIVSTV